MRKSSISGWQNVFAFTLKQTLKSRAFIISYLIMIILAIASMPVLNFFLSDKKDTSDAPSPIKKVYINNETTLPDMDFTGLLKGKSFSGVTFEKMSGDYDSVSKRIKSEENDSVILTVSEQQGVYSLAFVKASEGPVGKSDLERLGDSVSEAFTDFRINVLGITEDQMAMINAPVSTVVSLTDVNGAPIIKEDTSISYAEYWFIYGIFFVVLMVNMMASTQIATSIVTEKSTRVIEYLLISIKPLALMIGKVLAMLVAVLLQIGSMVAMVFVSNAVVSSINPGSKGFLSQYLPENIFQNLNIFNIILCFILMLLGLIFYAILAGLAGSTVSKLEEIQEGLTLFTAVSLIGAYMGIGAASTLMATGQNSYVTFCLMFPLSSPFILPGALLVGKAGLVTVIIASLLQIVFIVLLFRFVAKVFEALILHTGNKIKINELFKISRTA